MRRNLLIAVEYTGIGISKLDGMFHVSITGCVIHLKENEKQSFDHTSLFPLMTALSANEILSNGFI